jgi:uncharacterized protein YhbP (UPF0306 family)
MKMMVNSLERLEAASVKNGWINTVDADKPEVLDKARQIIESNIYCSLSTCSVDGMPWATPLFFIYDEQWNIYWSSAINCQHSQNIYTNHGRVAVAIYGSVLPMGTGQGLYFMGTAAELDSQKIEWAIDATSTRSGKVINRTAADYLNDSCRRFYQFTPSEAWVTGSRIPVENQLVDTKIRLDLDELRA